MVQIGRVLVVVLDGVVAVGMSVLARDRRLVSVPMVSVVVPVNVGVLDGLMSVTVPVALGRVQVDGHREQRRGPHRRQAGLAEADAGGLLALVAVVALL